MQNGTLKRKNYRNTQFTRLLFRLHRSMNKKTNSHKAIPRVKPGPNPEITNRLAVSAPKADPPHPHQKKGHNYFTSLLLLKLFVSEER